MNPIAFMHRQLSYFIGMPEDRRILLFRTDRHASPTFAYERAQIMLRRTEVLAWVFMILVPLWILVDARVFPSEVVISLATGRVVASVLLGLLLIVSLVLVKRANGATAYLTLLCLLAVPALFGVYAQSIFTTWQLDHAPFSSVQVAAYSLYQFLPMIYIAGLALFPMTLSESAPIALALTAMVALMDMRGFDPGTLDASSMSVLWTLLVIGGSASLAGVLQLNLMWQNHALRILDDESGIMKRKAALEAMQKNWHGTSSPHPITVGMVERAGIDGGRVALDASNLQDKLEPGMWAVRWSEGCLGVLGIGRRSSEIEQLLFSLDFKASDGASRRFSIADRLDDHGFSPLNLVQIAEKKLQRQ